MKIGEIINRLLFRLGGRVVRLRPSGTPRGNVLISYLTLPFLNKDPNAFSAHTNRWECKEIANIFLERGYAVDVIDFANHKFVPKKKYDYFIDLGENMERLAPLMGKDCVKILHITGAYWEFQNNAEKARLEALEKRRGVELPQRRAVPPSRAIEVCDAATMLGSDFTLSTYPQEHQHKIFRIPLSTTHTYESPENKDFDRVRRNVIWFGGAGLVHKGLDLVLEAFAAMPEYNLMVYGKIGEGERDLLDAYKKELSLPNITVGEFIDPGGSVFKELRENSLSLIYPSCSEGQSGSVILCMHAGLIPIISRESGVDVDDFGVILKENTIEEIKKEVRAISSLPTEELRRKAVAAWRYANEHHTRETFAAAYRAFVDTLEKK